MNSKLIHNDTNIDSRRIDHQKTAYLRPYTKNWNNRESDSIHLEYSYDKTAWYALNGNNGVIFPTKGSCQLINPKIYNSKHNQFEIIAADALNPEFVFVFKTNDFIEIAKECYMEHTNLLTKDELKNTSDDDFIEIPMYILSKLQKKWGKPEPVHLVEIEHPQIDWDTTKELSLPHFVKVRYSNGMTEQRKANWLPFDSKAALNSSNATITGTVKETIYKSPFILHRADPYIYKHLDGTYYFTASYTDMEHNLDGKYQYLYIVLRKASTLSDLADGSGNYQEKIVYERKPIANGTHSPHIWAPEIHMIQGKWYIYYSTTISDESPWKIRPHCLACQGNDPFTDMWITKGPMVTTVDNDIAFTDFSLDHTHFHHNGTDYLMWAQKTNNISDIFIAKLSNPWTICTKSTLVVHPEYNWETHGFAVNEGPAVIKHGDKIFMTFSASGTDAQYCMGLIYADSSADLLDRASWYKCPHPVFQSSPKNGQYGPGHNSFTYSDDDSEILFVYHCRQEERYLVDENYQPLYDAGRNAFVGKVFWDENGMPEFSVPGERIVTDEEHLIIHSEIIRR